MRYSRLQYSNKRTPVNLNPPKRKNSQGKKIENVSELKCEKSWNHQMKILCRKTDGLGDYDWTEISKEKKIHFQLKYFRLILKIIMTSFWDKFRNLPDTLYSGSDSSLVKSSYS